MTVYIEPHMVSLYLQVQVHARTRSNASTSIRQSKGMSKSRGARTSIRRLRRRSINQTYNYNYM